MIKDFLGREAAVGDYFAYPLIIGRSANIAIFQLTEPLPDGRVKARPVKRAYGDDRERRYKEFDFDSKTGLGQWRDMTAEERAKVDGKRSLLNMFNERAMLIPFDPSFE